MVTEFPQEGDKGYYTINYDWLDGPKEVSTQLDQDGKLTMTSSDLDTYGRRISSVTPEGKVSQFFYDADGHVQAKTIDGKAAFNLIVNGQVLGEEDKDPDNVMGSTYETATATALTAPPAMYRVMSDNETLEGIAQTLWGERNLWYLIGDANNLDRSAKLKAGDALRVPTRSNTVYNDSNSFTPYDASEQLGNTAPTMAPPKPPKKGGCGVIGQVIMVVVAVVVTWLTAGAATGVVASAMTTLGASTAVAGAVGTVVSGALSAALGSIASQTVGMAIGAQDGFNWKAVGLAAIGGGVTAGVGLAVDTGGLGSIFAEQGWQGAAARAVLANTMSQGIANITGLQQGFNWRSVVASGVGAAAGSVAAGALKGDNLLAKITAGNELAQRSTVGFIAGTATALARGGKIDVVTIATDAFGNALGESVADKIQLAQERAYREGVRLGTIDNEQELNTIRERSAARARRTEGQLSQSFSATANNASSSSALVALTNEQKIELVRSSIPNAIAGAESALSNAGLTSSERAKLRQSVDALHRSDLRFDVTDLGEEDTGATAKMSDGKPVITVNISGRQLFKDGVLNRSILTPQLVHEGQHVADFMEYSWSNGPATLQDERRTERNAYQVQAIYNKAVGISQSFFVPGQGVIMMTPDNSNRVAELSVRMWANDMTSNAIEHNRRIDRQNSINATNYQNYQRRNGLTGPLPNNYIQPHIEVPVYVEPDDLPRGRQ
ncbi:hypothetical protein [Massilia sp. YIM B04103]|uniref:hypothetical protein n=1 Tax=Massilia sp. YIM B04103 TaxID=2963106 RepID=UPI002108C348|nr:hypothetical protein [Massilia sp. YIM B04103]